MSAVSGPGLHCSLWSDLCRAYAEAHVQPLVTLSAVVLCVCPCQASGQGDAMLTKGSGKCLSLTKSENLCEVVTVSSSDVWKCASVKLSFSFFFVGLF